MQYKVPQFIEVEDKLFGPLTLKQFLYLAAAGGVTLAFITLLPLIVAIALSTPFIALGVALAFYRVNDRPLIVAAEHAFNFFLHGRLYLWKQRQIVRPNPEPKNTVAPTTPALPKFSESKLKDLAWSLNIKDRIETGEKDSS
ncbi:MAG: PrgI family protein [Minisyncoccia bacterium]